MSQALATRGMGALGARLTQAAASGGRLAAVAAVPPVPTPGPPAVTPRRIAVTPIVTAVLADGSRRWTAVPTDPRKPLAIAIGADVVVPITLVTAAGVPVDLNLAAGDSLIMTARARSTGPTWFRIVATVGPRRGDYEVAIGRAVTVGLTPARGVYDLWVTQDGITGPALALSELRLVGRAFE